MLDAPGARLRRALTFRRLYRCRACNALFEAISAGRGSRKSSSESARNRSERSDSSSEVITQGLAGETGGPAFCAPMQSGRRPEPIAEVSSPLARTMEDRFVVSIISPRIRESIVVKEMTLGNHEYLEQLCQSAIMISDALRTGHKIFFFGNGGSSAVSQHLAAEFMGRNLRQRPDFPAIALTVNASNLVAMGDDDSFELVFARQLRALGTRGDVAIGLSPTGNSVNVLRGVETAKLAGLVTVGLTGQSGGRLKTAADFCLCIPSTLLPRIHEAHILTGDILCEIVENELSRKETFLPSRSELSRPRRKSS
jgi:D-sedoheptulose 7-phosphate isomerase